jgi:hypothetical protein
MINEGDKGDLDLFDLGSIRLYNINENKKWQPGEIESFQVQDKILATATPASSAHFLRPYDHAPRHSSSQTPAFS